MLGSLRTIIWPPQTLFPFSFFLQTGARSQHGIQLCQFFLSFCTGIHYIWHYWPLCFKCIAFILCDLNPLVNSSFIGEIPFDEVVPIFNCWRPLVSVNIIPFLPWFIDKTKLLQLRVDCQRAYGLESIFLQHFSHLVFILLLFRRFNSWLLFYHTWNDDIMDVLTHKLNRKLR